MTTTTLPQADGTIPAPTGQTAGEVLCQRGRYEIDASAVFTTNSDKIEFGVLPAYHEIVDLIAELDDLDGGAGANVTVGIEKANGVTDDNDALIDGGGTWGRAAAIKIIDRTGANLGRQVPVAAVDRKIYLFAEAAPATDQDGTLTWAFTYTPTDKRHL